MIELARVETEQRGTTCLVRVQGEVDMSNVQDVSASIEAAVPAHTLEVVVDLSETTYLDSAGLAFLLRLSERLSGRRQTLSLVVPEDSPIRAVLEVTGLPNVMQIRTDLQDDA